MGFWSAVKRIASGVGRIVHEVVSRVLGIPDFIMSYLGILLWKNTRIKVLILRGQNGDPVEDPAIVGRAVDLFKQIMAEGAKVRVKSTFGPIVQIVEGNAPDAALRPRTGAGAWADEFTGEMGDYLKGLVSRYHPEATFPDNLWATPITCFIVEDIQGKNGWSLGPMTNYILLDKRGVSKSVSSPEDDVPSLVIDNLMAHEFGHSCFLFHRDNIENLMYANNGRGNILTQWQLMVLRSSRRVSFFQ